MRVLVGCEFSGIVRDAFRALGHEAWSCDLLDSESYERVVFADQLPRCTYCCDEAYCPKHDCHFAECSCLGPTQDDVQYRKVNGSLHGSPHFQCDVLTILDRNWDLAIFHPDCTYLCSSGLHWNKRRPERGVKTELALQFVRQLLEAPIPKIALENPIGCISTRIRPPDQIIQPYDFGHPESKQTCLWLKNLPKLQPTERLALPATGRWANQTPSGQNKLGPSPERWKIRARTYTGIAKAIAQQWSI